MAIRTIDAPGIEIREIDKSQYSPAMTGTKVLVTGFANSGEDYIPMIFTSKSAWLKYYGEPDNEAERYFYAASMEVLNQNGVVNCCKLPYENAARDKFVAKKYKLGMTAKTINTVSDVLNGDLSTLRDSLPNSSEFVRDTLDYFMGKVNITDVADKKTIQEATSFDALTGTVNQVDRSDDKTDYVGKSFYELYAAETTLSDTVGLSSEFVKQMSKSQLFKYIDNLESDSSIPYMNACYVIENSDVEDDELVQNISVLLAYDKDSEPVVLKAQNTVNLTSDELSSYKIKEINGFLSAEGINLTAISDDIFVSFEMYVPTKTYEYEDFQGLTVRKVSGMDAFMLSTDEELSEEAYEKILNAIKHSSYKLQGYETLEEAVDYIQKVQQNTEAIKQAQRNTVEDKLKWCEIKAADETVKTYLEITSKGDPSLIGISEVDEYRTDESRVGTNEIVIVDKTRRTYTKIPEDKNHKGTECELIGIIPVVTTAANALYAQTMIDVAKADTVKYETILNVQTLKNGDVINTLATGSDETAAVISKRFNNDHAPSDNTDDFFESLAMEANGFFTPIALQADGGFDRENMKKIGLVVFQAYLDASEGNKISFQAVEAFVGSLDRDDKNPNTGATTFIDTIVNEQSEYVNIFTNCIPTAAMKNTFKNVDILVLPHAEANVASFGFYEDMCKEDIDVSESILKALDIVYDKVTDINEREIDIVVDGGISNIAQFIKTVYGGTKGAFDPASPDAAIWKCAKDNDVKMWKTVIQKMDNFCKNIRKDCMFIADGPRPYCLQGQKKIVRPSKPKNTIDANILPYTKYLTGINTSYGAGYCDWFQVADEFSGDYFWCPPSIKACGVYIFTDLNFEYWDAPAGLNRGMVAALDVAFSPTNKQAGQIYTKSWNYAINYPQDGIILEGQRTLQSKPSALDRVNVRRLMLRLERAVYKVLRYVVYEGHTATLRQRVIDLIKPVFEQAKIGGGLYDYKLICDETINTPDVIDRNELKLKIGLKPTKTVEFIEATFTLLNTGASWSEM